MLLALSLHCDEGDAVEAIMQVQNIKATPLNRYGDFKEYIEKLGFKIVPFDEFHSVRFRGVHLFSIPPGKIYNERHDFHFWKSPTRNMIHRPFREYIQIADGWVKRRYDYVKEWKELERTKNYHENSSAFYE